jgi:hypothetical protein
MALMIHIRECHIVNHPSFAIVGLAKSGSSFLFWFFSHFVLASAVKENCLTTEPQVRDWIFTSTQGKPWVNGCIAPSFWLKLHAIVAPKNVENFMAVRHIARYAWAAYNFWNLPFDREINEDGRWAQPGINFRSPAMFHELMLSRGKVPFPGLLVWNESSPSVNFSAGFEQQQNSLSKNLPFYVLPSEEFNSEPFMRAVAARLTRIHQRCVDDKRLQLALTKVVNSDYSAASEGVENVMNPSEVRGGVYEISGCLPMLQKTCQFLVNACSENCDALNNVISKTASKLRIAGVSSAVYEFRSLKYCH